VATPLAAARLAGRVVVAEACGDVTHASARGAEGVRMQLLDAQGQFIAEETTDRQGNYAFDDLLPGLYALFQQQPPQFADGGCRPGNGGGQVLARNLIGEIAVFAGQSLTGYDFCERASAPGPVDDQPPPLESLGSAPTPMAAVAGPTSWWISAVAPAERKHAPLPLPVAAPPPRGAGLASHDLPPQRVWEPVFGGSSQVLGELRTGSAAQREGAAEEAGAGVADAAAGTRSPVAARNGRTPDARRASAEIPAEAEEQAAAFAAVEATVAGEPFLAEARP
jgi:hypothetical protein